MPWLVSSKRTTIGSGASSISAATGRDPRKTSARSAAWAWMRPAGAAGTTRLVDLDRPRVVFCTEGRDAESFGRFTADFEGMVAAGSN